MHPRRLLIFLAIFVVLAAAYYLAAWRQEAADQAERRARRFFAVKEEDITEIALKKADHEIRLARREHGWVLTHPLALKADQEIARQTANLLATLERERDLGEGQPPHDFGFDKPSLVAEFTASGKTHRLTFGQATPGNLGYYVRRDDDARLYTVPLAIRDSLDRPADAFRDKALFDFAVDKVQSVKLSIGPTVMDLEKTAGSWRWVGREDFKVRKDRLESLLRFLSLARVKEFLTAGTPPDAASLGFAPVPTATVAVSVPPQPAQTLVLGARRQEGFYARRQEGEPLFLVEPDLAQRILNATVDLEDRRLWSGDLAEVARLEWGPPEKRWLAVKEKESWQLTGPEGQGRRHPAVRLEAVLIKLQELEYQRLVSTPAAGKTEYLVELKDGAGQPLFKLAQKGKPGKDHLTLTLEKGGKQETAWLAKAAFEQWQADIARLLPPPAAAPQGAPPGPSGK